MGFQQYSNQPAQQPSTPPPFNRMGPTGEVYLIVCVLFAAGIFVGFSWPSLNRETAAIETGSVTTPDRAWPVVRTIHNGGTAANTGDCKPGYIQKGFTCVSRFDFQYNDFQYSENNTDEDTTTEVIEGGLPIPCEDYRCLETNDE